MRIALSLVLIGALFVEQGEARPLWGEAKADHGLWLDTNLRARGLEIVSTRRVTKAQFRKMQQEYRPQDFDMWAERLRQLQPGMTEKQVVAVLRPRKILGKVYGPGVSHIMELNDAYFALVRFTTSKPHRMEEATTPLAVTYEIISPHEKSPKT
jgi:hypothetical protein